MQKISHNLISFISFSGYIIDYRGASKSPYFHHTRIEPQLTKGALQAIVHSVSVGYTVVVADWL